MTGANIIRIALTMKEFRLLTVGFMLSAPTIVGAGEGSEGLYKCRKR